MARLHKTVTKFSNKYDLGRLAGQAVVGKDRERKLYDQGHFIGHSVEKSYDATKAAEKFAQGVQDEPVMPLPDDELLARAKKKGLARRNRGRASTILGSDAETLG
jgi:hypothetical protein